MLEAIVDVALRAILASVLLGGVLMLAVLVATRRLSITASTRHALWTIALIATAVMPIAGVAVSLARGLAPQPALVAEHAAVFDRLPAHLAALPMPPAVSRATPPQRIAAAGNPAGFRLPSLNLDFTPRLSRALALGVVGVWLAGALIGLGGLIASIVRVRGLKARSSPLEGDLADELPWLTESAAGREIYLRLSFEIETPVAIGFRRPVILIPTELATAAGLAAIESLILHEHAHLRRYDDWTNLVQRTIERIFWFNPVVWLVGRRIALEREIASDDAVVEKTGAAHEYATSLWRLAREMRMPEHAVVAPGALLTRKQISVRIERLLDKNRGRLHRSPAAACGVVVAGLLAVAFVATSAPAVELPAAAPLAAAPGELQLIADPLTDQKIAELEAQIDPSGRSATQHLTMSHPGTASSPAPHVAPTHAAPTRVVENGVHAEKHQRIIVVKQMRTVDPAVPPAAAPARVRDSVDVPVMPLAPVPPPPPLPQLPATHGHAAESPAAASAAGAAAAGAGARFGADVVAIVHDALGDLPKQIVHENAGMPHGARSLRGMKLTRELIAACRGCSLRNADLRGLDLHGLTLPGIDLTGADLRSANLAGARLTGVSLAHANLSSADLRGAVLIGVELRGANFDGALLDDVRLNGVSFRSVSVRGTALRSAVENCSGCDFSGMDLRGQDLHGITLTVTDLSRADLREANLANVHFTSVDLSHANLGGADLSGASLIGCDLGGANLHGAKTTGMTLQGSGFDG